MEDAIYHATKISTADINAKPVATRKFPEQLQKTFTTCKLTFSLPVFLMTDLNVMRFVARRGFVAILAKSHVQNITTAVVYAQFSLLTLPSQSMNQRDKAKRDQLNLMWHQRLIMKMYRARPQCVKGYLYPTWT